MSSILIIHSSFTSALNVLVWPSKDRYVWINFVLGPSTIFNPKVSILELLNNSLSKSLPILVTTPTWLNKDAGINE